MGDCVSIACVGLVDGIIVDGSHEGDIDGCSDGYVVGDCMSPGSVGEFVMRLVDVITVDGLNEGISEDDFVGILDGDIDGCFEGDLEGEIDGYSVGVMGEWEREKQSWFVNKYQDNAFVVNDGQNIIDC